MIDKEYIERFQYMKIPEPLCGNGTKIKIKKNILNLGTL